MADLDEPAVSACVPSYSERSHLALRPTRLPWVMWVGLGLAALVPRIGPVWRSGFSPDEEITVLTARGISADGLPRLPSGVVNSRGLGFSYIAWATGRIFGQTLPSYRVPSLLAGCATVLLTSWLATRLGGSVWLAGLLASGATMLVVASAWARFYAPFVASFLATSLVLIADGDGKRRDGWFLVGLAATRLFHEMGVTLLALPLFFYLQSGPGSAERDRYRFLLLRATLILAAIELAVASFPGGGPAPIAILATGAGAPRLLPLLLARSSFWSIALMMAGSAGTGVLLWLLDVPMALSIVAAACAATLNLGLLCTVLAGLLLADSLRARVAMTAGAIAGLASLALWSTHTVLTTDAGLSVPLVSNLAQAAFTFPLAALLYLARTWPITMLAGALGLLAGHGRTGIRAIAFLTLACLVFLGSLALGPGPRYFMPVLPFLFCLAAVVPVLSTRLAPRGLLGRVARAGMTAALLFVLVGEHEIGARDSVILEQREGSALSSLRTAPYERWGAVLTTLPAAEKVICNDDMGCLLAGRRPDYWWLGSTTEASLYGMQDGRASVYTGAPIIVGPKELAAVGRRQDTRTWVVLLDTTKYGFLELLDTVKPESLVSLRPVCAAEGIRLFELRGSPASGAGVPAKEVQTCPE